METVFITVEMNVHRLTDGNFQMFILRITPVYNLAAEKTEE